jgi:uncharacterized protein YbjT (DUF2867 family)
MNILVTGSTGKVGTEVIEELGICKVKIRALVCKVDAKLPNGIEVFVGGGKP